MIRPASPAHEHRLHPRLRVSRLEVSYRPAAAWIPPQRALAYDLSEEGMRLIAPARPPAPLLALLPRAPFVPDGISLQGRVLRCREAGVSCEWGVQLVAPGTGYRALVRRLLAEDACVEETEVAGSRAGFTASTRLLPAGIAVVEVRGCLDADTAPGFGEVFGKLFARGLFRLVVDLSGVDYLASAGVAVLLETFTKAREGDGDVVLMSPSDAAREVFALLGLTRVFHMAEDLPGALTAFDTGP